MGVLDELVQAGEAPKATSVLDELAGGAAPENPKEDKKVPEVTHPSDAQVPHKEEGGVLSLLKQISSSGNASPEHEKIDFGAINDLNREMNKETPVQNEKVAQAFDAAPATTGQAYQSWKTGYDEFMHHQDHSWLTKAGYFVSAPAQLAARELAVGLQNIGALPPDQAKQLLSQAQLVPSDIMKEAYWKDPKTMGERIARAVVGLGLDITLDPLMWMPPLLGMSEASKISKIGQTTIDLSRVSEGERSAYKWAQETAKIITEDGRVMEASGVESADKITQNNMNLVEDYVNNKTGRGDLLRSLHLTSDGEEGVAQLAGKISDGESFFNQVGSGEKTLKFGVKVPWINVWKEWDVPFASNILQPAGKQVAKTLEWAADTDMWGVSKLVQDIGKVKNLLSNTGFASANDAIHQYLGDKNLTILEANKIQALSKEMLSGVDAAGVRDILDEIEWSVRNPEDVLRRHGKSAVDELGNPSKDFLKLINGEQEAIRYYGSKAEKTEEQISSEIAYAAGRSQRMSEGAKDFVSMFKHHMDQGLQEYEKRGIPMSELNPFGEGWVNDYAKHIITNEFKKLADKDKIMNDVSEGLIHAKTGAVADASAGGRAYRGPINLANDISLENYSVKKYVDDPVEILVKRKSEMDRTIRAHDLLEAMIPHTKILNKDGLQEMIKVKQIITNNEKMAALGDVSAGKEAEKYREILANMADDFVPPKGYVKFDLDKDWTNAFVRVNKERVADESGNVMTQFDAMRQGSDAKHVLDEKYVSFLPRHYLENDVYLPEVLYDRVQNFLAPKENPLDNILGVGKMYNYLFKNSALFGTAYQGKILFSNMLAYGTAGTKDKIGSVADALHVLALPGERTFNFVDHLGQPYSLSKEQLYRTAVEYNVVKSGIDQTMQWTDLAENLASNRDSREKILATIGGKNITPQTIGDAISLYGFNRWVSGSINDTSKMALFIDRLKSGYSFQGASEAANRYFHSFTDMSKGAQRINKVIPFGAYPMKTVERMMADLKEGNFARTVIPFKANQVIRGEFVPDENTRLALDKEIPWYHKLFDPLHGQLMPGGREMLLMNPAGVHSLGWFMDPGNGIHPILKAIGSVYGIMSEHTQNEWSDQQIANGSQKFLVDQLKNVLPGHIHEAFALAELNGAIKFGGAFADQYVSKVPGDLAQESVKLDFSNNVKFGQYIESQLGENWLYKMMFPDRIHHDEDNLDQQLNLAARGKFVSSKISQMTLGLSVIGNLSSGAKNLDKKSEQEIKLIEAKVKDAQQHLATDESEGHYLREKWKQIQRGQTKLDSVDRTFLMNNSALDKRYDQLSQDVKTEMIAKGYFPSPDFFQNHEKMIVQSTVNPKIAELLSVKQKREALLSYYNWYLGVKQKFPEFDPFKLMFGIDHGIDFSQAPHELSPAFDTKQNQQNLLNEMNQ